jgi:hypothetical protein
LTIDNIKRLNEKVTGPKNNKIESPRGLREEVATMATTAPHTTICFRSTSKADFSHPESNQPNPAEPMDGELRPPSSTQPVNSPFPSAKVCEEFLHDP